MEHTLGLSNNDMTCQPFSMESMPRLAVDGGVGLNQLRTRECAVVQQVDAPCDDMERLMAMGVCAGRTVELIQTGDPLILKVYGTRVGVSARLAERIIVRHCQNGSCRAVT
jgi:Fe2+ transport system protein FeoA